MAATRGDHCAQGITNTLFGKDMSGLGQGLGHDGFQGGFQGALSAVSMHVNTCLSIQAGRQRQAMSQARQKTLQPPTP